MTNEELAAEVDDCAQIAETDNLSVTAEILRAAARRLRPPDTKAEAATKRELPDLRGVAIPGGQRIGPDPNAPPTEDPNTRLRELACRVLTKGHVDREVEKEWADELAVAVLAYNTLNVDTQ